MKAALADKTVSIVDRAASMLRCFTRERPALGLPELSERLGLPKPTVFRIATVLRRAGFLDQNAETGAYLLGPMALAHAMDFLASVPIRQAARPTMEALRDEINETIVLSLRDGDHRYNIDSVESTHAVGQTQQIGVAIPLYAGAASRVMLAAMGDDELEAYLARAPLQVFTGMTLATRGELLAATTQVRRDGHAVTTGEFTAGGHAVARLIRAPESYGVAALHVSIPRLRHSAELERKALDALRDGIAAIERELKG
ncbi:MAG TPA: IclR family transcriptional regulator [Stellaceae bacterium]|jgi:DNA-binding IclR family transcriptional regulator|nr:IclR family transcriptional regulator [Stellaceae bacterium]